MALKGASVAYCVVGGLVLYSGIKGATLQDTAKAVLSGNLTLQDTETIQFGSSSSSGASGTGVDGASILADAEKYNGHKYVFGGPSNPDGGWDCSSFVSYVLGHDLGIGIPGGTWATETNSGKSHGPVASAYLTWSGASSVQTSALQPGDLLCWETHVGFAVDSTHMFSAYDTQSGTLQTPIAGPGGEGNPVVRRVISATSAGVTSGSGSANLLTIGKYLMANGYSRAGAAGICGCIDGESGGNPESVGSGGGGLIGWTPLPAGYVTGNATKDLQTQLPAILKYNDGIGQGFIVMLNALTDPVQAADFYSENFEKPRFKDSDVRASTAKSIFSQLGGA